jgi:uncharacterized protein
MTGLLHKTMDIQTEVVTDQGWFSAIAAAYTPDRVGDVISRGAFQRTIARWRASGKYLPVHFEHKGDAEFIVGHIDPSTMEETAAGLYCEGRLDIKDSEVAREAWRSVKANRMSLSVGYLAQQHKGEDGYNHLTEVDLFEISLTAAPVQADTRFLQLKALSPDQQRDLDDELERLHAIFKEPVPEAKAVSGQRKAVTIASFEC